MAPVFDSLSSKVIAAAIKVHKQLGPGFLEGVYEQALRFELSDCGIPHESQKEIKVRYGDRIVGKHMLDLLVAEKLVVELKAVKGLEDIHYAQVKSYLKASGAEVGLLMNFNCGLLEVKRVVLNFEDRTSSLAVPEG